MSTIEQTLIARLVEQILAFGPAETTQHAIELARTAVIDTIGVALAGVVEPCTTNLMRTPGVAISPGPCTLFGTDRKTSALDAAFVNGTASHALDYDDFSEPMGGHQSAPLIAPLLAVAEERGLSGRQFLHAYILGIEVEIRLARAVNFHHYDKGWHPTATMGVFGVAAAVGYMIGLDEARLAVALAIAASFASGLKSNFGTMVKPLHVGQCGRNGLLAALLAESGYDANPATLEHKQGFFNAFNGPGKFNSERIFRGWASPLELTRPTMGLKQFPCCGSTHPAIVAALLLRDEEGITPNDIERIEIFPHARRLPHTDNPDPRTPLAAKFSVQYAVARALLSGAVRLQHFEDNAHIEPAVRVLMDRVSARPHPDMADDATEQFSAEVRVTLQNGMTVTRRVDGVTGRGGDNPMSSKELWEKFFDCARRALPKQGILPLFDRLKSIETVADMRSISRLLARPMSPDAQRGAPVIENVPPTRGNTLPETTWVP